MAASVVFVSCSDDKDEPVNPVPVPDVTEAVTPAQGNVFSAAIPNAIDGYQMTTNDKGQVTSIKSTEQEISIEYGTFSRAEYQAKATFRYNGQVEYEIYLQFNAQGFIASALQVYTDDDEADDTWSFEYNAAGQMTGMHRSEGDENYVITYTDGNITNVLRTEEDGDRSDYTISYTNETFTAPVVNTANIMLFDESFDIDMDEMSMLYFAGLLGQGTKNLPMQISHVGYEGGDRYEYGRVFFWEFNSDNLPIKFWSQESGSSYNYDELEFSWK